MVAASPGPTRQSDAAEGSATDRTWRARAAACGLAGPLALVVYFAAPALAGWPYGGGSAAQLIRYATGHQALFYAGAWLQATGTLLSIVFYLALVHFAGPAARFAGAVVTLASAALLALVLVECVFLAVIPAAALAGDGPTVVTAFALVNGVFVRIFPLAPSSGAYVGLGAVILRSGVLGRRFGQAAIGIGLAFELAGLLSIVSPLGLILGVALSVGQAAWIVAAALSLGSAVRWGRPPAVPAQPGPGAPAAWRSRTAVVSGEADVI